MFRFIINKINLYKIKKGKITIEDLYLDNKKAITTTTYKNITEDICLAVIDKDPFDLPRIPEEKRTYRVCYEAVSKDGYLLKYVPRDIITYNICLKAVSKESLYSSPLQFVPSKFKSYEICVEALKWNYDAIQYVPKKYRIQSRIIRAIQYNPLAISVLKPREISYKAAHTAVKKDIRTILYVPDKYLLRIINDFNISDELLIKYKLYSKVKHLKEKDK